MKPTTWRILFATIATGLIVTGCASRSDRYSSTPPRYTSTPVAYRTYQVVVSEAPPPTQVETIPGSPGQGYVWAAGHWVWRNGWVWEPGHWALAPRLGAEWVPGSWVRHRNGWTWREGYWR